MKKTIRNPLLALAGCFAAFNGTSTLQAQTTNIWNFNYTGSIVQWTVPGTGIYTISAYGAQGGQYSSSTLGGLGAVVSGSFQLNAGEVLSLLVGGPGNLTGQISFNTPAGGGGGSFVVLGATNTPLAVAGGGGGAAAGYDAQVNATTNTTGNNAWFYRVNQQGSGGSNGDGGTIGSDSYYSGGGGGEDSIRMAGRICIGMRSGLLEAPAISMEVQEEATAGLLILFPRAGLLAASEAVVRQAMVGEGAEATAAGGADRLKCNPQATAPAAPGEVADLFLRPRHRMS